EQLDELSEARQRAGQAVDLVDDDHVDLAGAHVVEKPPQGRPVGVAARKPPSSFGSQQAPSGCNGSPSLRTALSGMARPRPLEGRLRDHRHPLERAEILRTPGQATEGVRTMRKGSAKLVRCAIYTRVSTDQGLETSTPLDAQYDAAQAYLMAASRR